MLSVNNLTGFGARRRASAVAATATQTDAASSSGTTVTFTDRAISTAAASRQVVVGVTYRGSAGGSRTISSVTIGGVTATALNTNTSTPNGAQLFIASVPTGTTATIVVTMSGDTNSCSIVVWAAYDMASTATSAANDQTNTPFSNSIDVPAGGAAFATVFESGLTSGQSFNWSAMTEDVDTRISDVVWSGASQVFASAQTSLSVTATYSSTVDGGRMAVASFGPAP